MAYHQSGDRHPKNRSRPASTGRPELPNLAAWGITDSIEQRRLQLWGEAILRSIDEHKHRKARRREGGAK